MVARQNHLRNACSRLGMRQLNPKDPDDLNDVIAHKGNLDTLFWNDKFKFITSVIFKVSKRILVYVNGMLALKARIHKGGLSTRFMSVIMTRFDAFQTKVPWFEKRRNASYMAHLNLGLSTNLLCEFGPKCLEIK